MRRALVFLVVLTIPTVALAQLDWYPKTTLAEDVTATWCVFCPNAYDGLDVVHATYDHDVFVSARYYDTSGQLGNSEVDAAIDYYSTSMSFPSVIFDGTLWMVGAGSLHAAGGPYLNVVESKALEPAPISVEIDSFNAATGEISATVTMHSTTEALAGDYIRFLLMEDHIWVQTTNPPARFHDNVTRTIVNDTITLTGQGNSLVFNKTFTVDPSWVESELHAMVFVQRALDKEVVQAASSKSVPDYRVRAMAPFSRLKIGASSGTYTSERFTILNVGLADTYNISLVVDTAPAGWTAEYCDAADTCQSTQTSFSLAVDEAAEYYVKVTPSSSGYMNYHVQVDSTAMGSSVVVPFSYFSDDIDVLMVDDDGGQSYETYFTSALEAAGLSYGVWDLAKGKMTSEVAAAFPLLVWSNGPGYPDADDLTFLRSYLDEGNSLFITGQDIGWGLARPSGGTDPAFFNSYLHASYLSDDANFYVLEGVTGDPVSDRLTLTIQGGDGANNQDYPEEVEAFDGDGVEIFSYTDDGDVGAVRSVDSTSRALVVYLGFGFEAIDNPTDRAALMGSAVKWLQGHLFSDGFETGNMSEWSISTP